MYVTMSQIRESADFIKKQGITDARFAVILGTGLGDTFLKKLKIEKSLDYKNIPNFPLATVEFHSGKLHYGSISEETRIIVMQGRFHYYEGHSMAEITFPIRVLKLLGIENLLISIYAMGEGGFDALMVIQMNRAMEEGGFDAH